jgi:hypothetical protein
VIGHSTYDTPENDPPGIIAWIQGKTDKTFSAFFNRTTTTGLKAAKAGPDERADFFHSMAFYNFVPHSLGKEDRHPTAAEYVQAAKDLPAVIKRAQPRAIFVFGESHHWYSLRVIGPTGIPYVDSVHPVQDKYRRFLPAWHKFAEMLKSLP